MAQDLEARNTLVIQLEQRNAALSDTCASQGPTSAVRDKTPAPSPSLEAREHWHKKSTCLFGKWLAKHMLELLQTEITPQDHFPLFPLCHSLPAFWELVFSNLKPARVFSLQFSAPNTARSSQNTLWTGFKYLRHSVIVAINPYVLLKQLHKSVPCLLCSPYNFRRFQSFIFCNVRLSWVWTIIILQYTLLQFMPGCL